MEYNIMGLCLFPIIPQHQWSPNHIKGETGEAPEGYVNGRVRQGVARQITHREVLQHAKTVEKQLVTCHL